MQEIKERGKFVNLLGVIFVHMCDTTTVNVLCLHEL
jgi:hypothetical protein